MYKKSGSKRYTANEEPLIGSDKVTLSNLAADVLWTPWKQVIPSILHELHLLNEDEFNLMLNELSSFLVDRKYAKLLMMITDARRFKLSQDVEKHLVPKWNERFVHRKLSFFSRLLEETHDVSIGCRFPAPPASFATGPAINVVLSGVTHPASDVAIAQKRFCPSCGTAAVAPFKFCAGCGSKIGE